MLRSRKKEEGFLGIQVRLEPLDGNEKCLIEVSVPFTIVVRKESPR